MAPAVATYEPHDPNPSRTILYKVIAEHLETFLASLDADPAAKGLPDYVQREFYDYLQCGIFGPLLKPLTDGLSGITEEVRGFEARLKGLRGTVNETQKDWEQRLQNTITKYEGLDKTIQNLATSAGQAAQKVAASAEEAMDKATDAIRATVKETIDEIVQGVTAAHDTMVQRADDTWENLKAHAAVAAPIVSSTLTSIGDAGEKAFDKVKTKGKEAIDTPTAQWKAGAEAIAQGFQDLGEKLRVEFSRTQAAAESLGYREKREAEVDKFLADSLLNSPLPKGESESWGTTRPEPRLSDMRAVIGPSFLPMV